VVILKEFLGDSTQLLLTAISRLDGLQLTVSPVNPVTEHFDRFSRDEVHVVRVVRPKNLYQDNI